jgi:hypothetical protein
MTGRLRQPEDVAVMVPAYGSQIDGRDVPHHVVQDVDLPQRAKKATFPVSAGS